jgi:hypothetical protein
MSTDLMFSLTDKKTCCASDSKRRRLGSFAGSILPGAVLVLIPKCPFCIIAYVTLISGVGLSIPAAANLRTALIVVSAVCLLGFAVSFLLSFKGGARKEI